MASKTNALWIVQQAKISCREEFYESDENDQGMQICGYEEEISYLHR